MSHHSKIGKSFDVHVPKTHSGHKHHKADKKADPGKAPKKLGAKDSFDANADASNVDLGAGASSGRRPLPRNWKTNPAVLQAANPKDLYCVGDVHGDYKSLLNLLNKEGLIKGIPASPAQVQWTGGAATLVCTGDIIDKWKDSTDAIQLFRSLQASAGAAGGRVIVTMGNHEAEFLADPTNKKAAPFVAELQKLGVNPQDVATGRDSLGIGAWMRGLPIGAKVGDWFFAHAGNTGGRTMAQLESDIEKGVDHDGFASKVLMGANSPVESTLGDGSWWTSKASAADNMKALGVTHLVEGHQPGKVTLSDGTVRQSDQLLRDELKGGRQFWLIDAGMSAGADKTGGEMLHVHEDGRSEIDTVIDAQGNIKRVDG